jgi:hypothetical protein
MENLGHYLLRERVPIQAPLEVYEGQDVRTGVTVLVFKPLTEALPKAAIAGSLNWIDQEEAAWIAEIPVGAV